MRTRSLVLPVALAVLQSGCNDLLTENPKSVITTEGFFRSAADAEAAIAAAYQPLSSGDVWDTALQWGLNAASDDARVGPEEENNNIIALTQLRWDPRNPYVAGSTASSGPWAGLYRIITRANLILERVPEIEMDATAKDQVLAQAKFLRALAYFYLVRLYGDVPLVTTTAEQFAFGARTPKADVYARIIQDATEAETVLPLSWDAAGKGRATQGAADALLAELYLWRSSAEGTNEWQQAADAAKKIIDSGVYALLPNYIDAFLPRSETRSEEVFAAQASNATGAPSLAIAYWTYPRALDPNGRGGWGTYQPLPWFIASYPAGDYRREVSFFTSGTTPSGQDTTFLPHIYKYRPTNRPGPFDDNWPIYRYADVLLMYAEALNELGEPGQAIQYVNQVRARARNGTGAEGRAQPADLPATSQAATREAIFQERHWELAFEGKRWFDMVRRGADYFLAAQANDPTATDPQATDMLWPIPQAQIDLNPQLTQNPGY
jgi:starch-binding outer membrane protein, SusD/RagB family